MQIAEHLLARLKFSLCYAEPLTETVIIRLFLFMQVWKKYCIEHNIMLVNKPSKHGNCNFSSYFGIILTQIPKINWGRIFFVCIHLRKSFIFLLNLIETKVSIATFMLYKPLWAFPHVPGACGGTFSSPTGGFALPFAAAASCCAISLWVRSLRRLKHSRDIAVQLWGCPPGRAHKEQGLTSCSSLHLFWQCPCALSRSFTVTGPLSFWNATGLFHCDSLFVLRRWKHGEILWITLKRLQWNLLSKQETQAVQTIRSETTEQLKWTNISGDGNTVLKQYKH